ncbi:hypothetical protein HON22_03995 [Candidatus Peregrinibacteria bacterium]|jgi:hypothetical protein|nr:hypothetical protein [Candidatus Peregrinibacteria bacterium]
MIQSIENTYDITTNPVNTLLDYCSKWGASFVKDISNVAQGAFSKDVSKDARNSIQCLVNAECLDRNANELSVTDNRLKYHENKKLKVLEYCNSLSEIELNDITNEIFSEVFYKNMEFKSQKDFDVYSQDYIYDIMCDRNPDTIGEFIHGALTRAASVVEERSKKIEPAVHQEAKDNKKEVCVKSCQKELRNCTILDVQKSGSSLFLKLKDDSNKASTLTLNNMDETFYNYLYSKCGNSLEMNFDVQYSNLTGSGVTQYGSPETVVFPHINGLGRSLRAKVLRTSLRFAK